MADWDTSPDDWEEDFDEENSDETIPCPHCQRPIHEDAQRCPYCELYLSEETAPPTRSRGGSFWEYCSVCTLCTSGFSAEVINRLLQARCHVDVLFPF